MTVPPLDQIVSALRGYIEPTLLAGRPVGDEEDLLLSGLLDSLAVMSLVAFVEERFALKVPFDDVLIENFESISALAAYVEGRMR